MKTNLKEETYQEKQEASVRKQSQTLTPEQFCNEQLAKVSKSKGKQSE